MLILLPESVVRSRLVLPLLRSTTRSFCAEFAREYYLFSAESRLCICCVWALHFYRLSHALAKLIYFPHIYFAHHNVVTRESVGARFFFFDSQNDLFISRQTFSTLIRINFLREDEI